MVSKHAAKIQPSRCGLKPRPQKNKNTFANPSAQPKNQPHHPRCRPVPSPSLRQATNPTPTLHQPHTDPTPTLHTTLTPPFRRTSLTSLTSPTSPTDQPPPKKKKRYTATVATVHNPPFPSPKLFLYYILYITYIIYNIKYNSDPVIVLPTTVATVALQRRNNPALILNAPLSPCTPFTPNQLSPSAAASVPRARAHTSCRGKDMRPPPIRIDGTKLLLLQGISSLLNYIRTHIKS